MNINIRISYQYITCNKKQQLGFGKVVTVGRIIRNQKSLLGPGKHGQSQQGELEDVSASVRGIY